MKRWSSNLLCGLAGGSLLIFLLAMGIWVRSFFVWDSIIREFAVQRSNRFWLADGIGCEHGWLTFYRGYGTDSRGPWYREVQAAGSNYAPVPWYRVVYYSPSPGSLRFGTRLWLFGLFAIPPLLWVRRYRRKPGRGFPVQVVQTTA